MTTSNGATSSVDVDHLLALYDFYIVALAWMRLPRNVVPAGQIIDEVEDLAQRTRVKFWQSIQRAPILNPKAYIWRIMSNDVTDMVRQYKRTIPMSLIEEDELAQGTLLALSSEETQDPLEIYEQEEHLAHAITIIVQVVQALPDCQREAALWFLGERCNECAPLIDALKRAEIDIRNVRHLEKKEEILRLQGSLTHVRRKLQAALRAKDDGKPVNKSSECK